MKITVDTVMGWHPCPEYTHARVEALWAGRESLTPLEIAALDIPAEDRLWALLRPEIIPARQLHLFACEWAEEVLPLFEREYPNDKRPRAAIETKRRWLDNEATDEELSAAIYAAWASAWAAARDAAGAAARDAAIYAVWAARVKVQVFAGEKQLQRVVEILEVPNVN